MTTNLSFAALPDLPQCALLKELTSALWQRQDVRALWLGGSLARGNADLYSDVDLRVSVTPETLEAWTNPDFETLFSGRVLARQTLDFGAATRFHHLLLTDGAIYDLWIQSAEHPHEEADVLVLGCRDEALRQRLQNFPPRTETPPPAAEAETLRTLLVWFWMNSHKHRKVLHRGLHLLVLSGLQSEQATLLRLWYALATGRDAGETQGKTIYGLTAQARVVEQARGSEALEVLGVCLSSREAILRAIERNREEVSAAGRSLAAALGFVYPAELEEMVRREWETFLSTR